MKPAPRTAFILFISIAVILFIQAVWWVAFMAMLTDEKVDIANKLGADSAYVEELQTQETRRQIMLGMEGVVFLMLVLVGAGLIYRALVKAEELKFHQQNFLMAVTHELKTPLASIQIYLDSLQSPKISSERKELMIPRMKDDVDRLGKLVENILDAGRFERNGYQIEISEFDLSSLLADSISKIKNHPKVEQLEVSSTISDNLLIQGDFRAIKRAINAILENSLKYTDKEKIELKVDLKEDGDDALLTIADNGIGLTNKECREIFDRFYRVGQELNRSKPGSGLGLYLSREIIRAHGGSLIANSPGLTMGSEFVIRLRKDASN